MSRPSEIHIPPWHAAKPGGEECTKTLNGSTTAATAAELEAWKSQGPETITDSACSTNSATPFLSSEELKLYEVHLEDHPGAKLKQAENDSLVFENRYTWDSSNQEAVELDPASTGLQETQREDLVAHPGCKMKQTEKYTHGFGDLYKCDNSNQEAAGLPHKQLLGEHPGGNIKHAEKDVQGFGNIDKWDCSNREADTLAQATASLQETRHKDHRMAPLVDKIECDDIDAQKLEGVLKWKGWNQDARFKETAPSTWTPLPQDTKKISATKKRCQRWTPEEDEKLRCIVIHLKKSHSNGTFPWSTVADQFPDRQASRCRDRWLNHLDPEVNRGLWTDREKQMLLKLHQQLGSKWTDIARALGTRRTAYDIKKTATKMLKQREIQGAQKTDDIRKFIRITSRDTGGGSEAPLADQQAVSETKLPPKVQTDIRCFLPGQNCSGTSPRPFLVQLPSVLLQAPTKPSADGLKETQQEGEGVKKRNSSKKKRARVDLLDVAFKNAKLKLEIENEHDLKKGWRNQECGKRTGQWKPSGGWKPPSWAIADVVSSKTESQPDQDSNKHAEKEEQPSELLQEQPGKAPPREEIGLLEEAADPIIVAVELFNLRKQQAARSWEKRRKPALAAIVKKLIDQHMPASKEEGELEVSLVRRSLLTDVEQEGEGMSGPTITNDDTSKESTNAHTRTICHFYETAMGTIETEQTGNRSDLATVEIESANDDINTDVPHSHIKSHDHQALGSTRQRNEMQDEAQLEKQGINTRGVTSPAAPRAHNEGRGHPSAGIANSNEQEQQGETNFIIGRDSIRTNTAVPHAHTKGHGHQPAGSIEHEQERQDEASSISMGGDSVMTNNDGTSTVNTQGLSRKKGNPRIFTEIRHPGFFKPSDSLLIRAHAAMCELLPAGDCENIDVLRLAVSYYQHWRPKYGGTKVVLLAESHAFTNKDRALYGPGLDPRFLTESYNGPRGFVNLVYSFVYGEDEALAPQAPFLSSVPNVTQTLEPKSTQQPEKNAGTAQFWSLLAACSRGTFGPHLPTSNKNVKTAFAADVLKGGGLPVAQRLEAKLGILKDLQQRGIWLLDASLFGWYIAQPQKYKRSTITKEVHRTQRERPPHKLKVPALIMAWEMHTKHLVREVAEEGNLQLLIPIGKDVEAMLTRQRMEEAVNIPAAGLNNDQKRCLVTEAFPAPNAWVPGGYGHFHTKLAEMVWNVAPPLGIEDHEGHATF